MEKKDTRIVKIIYFDEGSATDLIYVLAGGKEHTTNENIVQKTLDLSAEANANIKSKFNLLSLFSANVGVEAESAVMREGKSIVTKALETTILTDYLKIADDDSNSFIVKLPECMPYPYPDSFAYFKMITPYLSMTDGSVKVDEDFKLNLSLMDKALDSGRGYYELVTDLNDEKIVLRFNIKAFRNNYFISDLVKMKLEYHAIEVGTITEEKLSMQYEFGGEQKKEIEVSGYDLSKEEIGTNAPKEMKVYDVILAGVRR